MAHLLEMLGDGSHGQLLDSFYKALNDSLNEHLNPVPLYLVQYDPGSHNFSLDILEGAGSAKEGTEITALDMFIASNLLSIPTLCVGDTGTGKTYIAENYLGALFGKGNFHSMRLSGNAFTNNLFQPFLETSIENGSLETRIRKDRASSCGAVFIDEINRGKSDQSLAILDGKINSSGEEAAIGINIPEYDRNGNLKHGTTTKKSYIVAACNPDSEGFKVNSLDKAVKNRFVEIKFPNTSASQEFKPSYHDPSLLHGIFIDNFARRLSETSGLSHKKIQEALQNDWLDVYAYIADPEKFEVQNTYSSYEFSDFAMQCMSKDLDRILAAERSTGTDLCSRLSAYGADIQLIGKIENTEEMKRLGQLVEDFDSDVVPRDKVYVNKLASLYSLIKKSKGQESRIVTVEDASFALSCLASSKSRKAKEPGLVVNTALREYVDVLESYSSSLGYINFKPDDPNAGIKRIAVMHSLKDGKKAKDIVGSLIKNAARLSSTQYKSELGKVLISRNVNDLLALSSFMDRYSKEIDARLLDSSGIVDAYMSLKEFCYDKISDQSLPSIYRQRLTRVFG